MRFENIYECVKVIKVNVFWVTLRSGRVEQQTQQDLNREERAKKHYVMSRFVKFNNHRACTCLYFVYNLECIAL